MEQDIFEFEYSIYEDDGDAVSVAINVARRLLQEPKVTTCQIVRIAYALYALERRLVVTLTSKAQFGVVAHTKIEFPDNPEETVDLSDMEYIHFLVLMGYYYIVG
ncbi:MAG: hypothetical protein OXD54_13480 [Candidatus Poribacteria bacterium]|nr:hypothetical protein [Candidatus Poribacteria bacterium]